MNAPPLAHFTNCAERVNTPRTMLDRAGFGMMPAAICTSNPGPIAMAARFNFFSPSVETISSNRRAWPSSWSQQGVEIFRCQLFEKRIESVGQSRAGKAGRGRTLFQSELAKGKRRLPPVLRDAAQQTDQVRRRARRQIFFAIAPQRLAGLADHGRGGLRFRREIGEEIVRQLHGILNL